MDEGDAQCLIDSIIPEEGEQKRQVTLKDFKIIKVIDKGSFGKVFLVV